MAKKKTAGLLDNEIQKEKAATVQTQPEIKQPEPVKEPEISAVKPEEKPEPVKEVVSAQPKIEHDAMLAEEMEDQPQGHGNVTIGKDKKGNLPPLPEQVIETPVIDLSMQDEDELVDPGAAEKPSEPLPPMPGIAQLDKKEQNEAAELLADVVIDIHNFLYEGAEGIFKLDENKMQMLAIKGKFKYELLDMPLPMDEAQTKFITLKDFIAKFNKELHKICDKESRTELYAKCRPVLIRLFIKLGWGIKDEWYLLFIVGKKTIQDVAVIWALNAGKNDIIKVAQYIFDQTHKQVYNPPPQNQTIVTPPPADKKEPEEPKKPEPPKIEVTEEGEKK